MTPITVLHTRIVTGSGGGPEKTILNSPRFLRGTRYRELACYLRRPADPGFAALRAGAAEKECPLIEIDDHGPLDFGVLRRLAAVARRHDVRVWHGHDYKTNLFGLLLRPRLGFRLVTTVHGWVSRSARERLYYAVDRATLRFYDQVVAVSDDLFARCAAAGVAADRLHLLENGIDTDAFRRSVSAAAAPLRQGVPPGRLVVGGIGRLAPEKGFDHLIAATRRLLDAGVDLELWIAGEGTERPRLAALAAASGHGDRIRLLGFQPDPRRVLEACDIFCLSSLREGLPNVVLEAMAMTLPVLATSCGGLAAFGRDGEDMLLVPPGDVGPLAAGLRRLAHDAALRRRLAAAARRRVESECSFRRRMERMAAVYDRLWDQPPAGSAAGA
jgi:glycosyltransferase involved in cell wall biosynthesis